MAKRKEPQTSAGKTAATEPEYANGIDKLRDEMAKHDAGSAVHALGEMMMEILRGDPEAEKAIAAKGKSLEGALQAIHDYANQQRGKAKAYCVPPDRAAAIACEYYGIKAAKVRTTAPAAVPEAAPAPEADPFDLDVLLGVRLT